MMATMSTKERVKVRRAVAVGLLVVAVVVVRPEESRERG